MYWCVFIVVYVWAADMNANQSTEISMIDVASGIEMRQ